MGEEAVERDSRFGWTFFVVKADSFARHALWRDHAAEAVGCPGIHAGQGRRETWDEDSSGLAIQIGEFGGMPVVVDCLWATIGGRLVLFYHACSMVTHSRMVDDWLKGRCNPTWDGGRRRAHCDAMNFHHCLHAIRESKGEAE